ncbi:hypothetical protein D0Z07_0748 [Hyphodiscus hymeniophilus]|uniref:Uncharacterized protein n=1 Tax=Hyphodiscus hymeniophilus TaxID=353542 RepID=A0A9P7B1D4_9HELO|nr:hypothetical protein D0Z07_0748 [Hyphodiscus hymeniophilus]
MADSRDVLRTELMIARHGFESAWFGRRTRSWRNGDPSHARSVSMESVDLSKPANGKMEIFKDAFALPQQSRTVKAWERAPVPAHIPRLQGQKIWKRTGLQSQREQDKENFNAAQYELKMEGMGARKRLRLLGAKENIGDATWSQDGMDHSDLNVGILKTEATESTNRADSAAALTPSIDAAANALQFVPRKRTNANHVITPKKTLRQTTLNGHVQTQSFVRSPHPSPEQPRRRKSMRKSIRHSVTGSMLQIPALVEERANMEDCDPSDTPRSSLVEAKFDDGNIIEQVKSSPERPTSDDGDAAEQLETPSEHSAHDDTDTSPEPELAMQSMPVISQIRSDAENEIADRLLNEKLNALFGLTDPKSPSSQEPQPELEEKSESDLGEIPSFAETSTHATKVPLNHSAEEAKSQAIQPQGGQSENETIETPEIDENELSRGRQALETGPMILQSIEANDESDVNQQVSKTTSTPKRKRVANQRKGTRRSTRTTRASSVRAEEQIAPGEAAAIMFSVASDGATQDACESVGHDAERNIQTTVNEPAEILKSSQILQDQETADVPSDTTPAPELQESVRDQICHIPFKATDLKGGEEIESENFAKCEEVGMDEFDVSAQLILQLSTENQQLHIVDEDFDLQPGSVTKKATLSVGPPAETKLELVSEIQGTLISPGAESLVDSSPLRFSPICVPRPECAPKCEDVVLEIIEPVPVSMDSESVANKSDTMSLTNIDLPGSSTPDPTTSKLVETISENAQVVAYDHDETDMLRNFLTRVQANKAAKAGTHIPKRKRSLPHSPLRLPLGETTMASPSPQKTKEEFDISLPGPPPSKRQKLNDPIVADEDDTITERKPTRRSGRTRLPVIKTPLGAPSHIPVRRLGQDGDTTVTLKRSEERELAALTKLNTRKNKAGFQSVPEFLAKKLQEKEDPALRQRLLKEVFDEKAQKVKKERRKTVVWAEELTHYQTVEGRKLDVGKEEAKETEKVIASEEKKSAVKVGIRSKIALGMAVNGTPAPKRKKRVP